MKKFFSLVIAVLLCLPLGLLNVKADSASGTIFAVTKTGTPSTVNPSSAVAFAISVENISSASAVPEEIVDTLPQGWTYNNDAKLTNIDGEQSIFAPSISGQTLTWSLTGSNAQTVAQGDNIVISFTATSPSATGSYTNEGCLTLPERVCAEASVTVEAGGVGATTTPDAGLKENVMLLSGTAILLFVIAYLLVKDKRSFEQKLVGEV